MNVKAKIAKSAEGYPLLGHCIYWSVYKFESGIDDVIVALKKAKIDESFAKEPKAKTALTKAMRELAKNREGSFHRKVIDEEQKATFALVDSKIDYKKEDVKFKTATKATLNKESQGITVEGDRAEDIKKMYEQFKTNYTSDQFVALVKRYIFAECDAITVRDSGGVYFIPSTHNAQFEKLRSFFDQFPASVSVDVIPVIDTKEAKKSMWKALVGKVEKDIADMNEDISKLPRDPRAGVIEARIEKYKSLKDKVESYEMLLSHTAKDLKSKIEQVGETLRNRMGS